MSECIFTAAMFYHEVWVRIKKLQPQLGICHKMGQNQAIKGKNFGTQSVLQYKYI